MKARQLNFYLDNQDLEKIEKYLQKTDFQIFTFPIRQAENVQLKADTRLSNTRYLVRKVDTDFVLANRKQLPIHLPLIEYTVTHCEKDGFWVKGRLFYYAYRQENGVWISQDADFVRAAERFFRWFRSHFSRQTQAPFLGTYASSRLVGGVA